MFGGNIAQEQPSYHGFAVVISWDAIVLVTPKGVLHLAKCDASATRKGL